MSRKMIEHLVESKRIFVGLEDSKKSWKLAVRCGRYVDSSNFNACRI